jgi:tRNA (guanine37-N1)-methyltransferase
MSSFFRPPAMQRLAASAASKTLDRAAFSRRVPIARALVQDPRNIGPYRQKLARTREVLELPKISPIQSDEGGGAGPKGNSSGGGAKWLVLVPTVDPARPETWSAALREGVEAGDLAVGPWELALDYDFWSYCACG